MDSAFRRCTPSTRDQLSEHMEEAGVGGLCEVFLAGRKVESSNGCLRCRLLANGGVN